MKLQISVCLHYLRLLYFFNANFFSANYFFYMQFSRCLVGSSGLEPPTSRLSGVRSNQLSYEPSYFALPVMLPSPILSNGGGKRIRTDDPLLAKQVLYQLSYTPVCRFASRSLCPFERAFAPSKPYSAFSLPSATMRSVI